MKLPDLPKLPQESLTEEDKNKFKQSFSEWIRFIKELYPTIKEELYNIQRGEEIVGPLPVSNFGSVFGPIPAPQVMITDRGDDFMIEATLICPTIKEVQAKIEMLFPDDKSTSDSIER